MPGREIKVGDSHCINSTKAHINAKSGVFVDYY